MHVVCYSNYAGRLVLGGGQSNYWNTEVYPLESIKEFEQISSAWQKLLARLLKEGARTNGNCIELTSTNFNQTENLILISFF